MRPIRNIPAPTAPEETRTTLTPARVSRATVSHRVHIWERWRVPASVRSRLLVPTLITTVGCDDGERRNGRTGVKVGSGRRFRVEGFSRVSRLGRRGSDEAAAHLLLDALEVRGGLHGRSGRGHTASAPPLGSRGPVRRAPRGVPVRPAAQPFYPQKSRYFTRLNALPAKKWRHASVDYPPVQRSPRAPR